MSKKRKISDSKETDSYSEKATEMFQREGNIYFVTPEYIQNTKA